MDLLEYEGKALFRTYGIDVPKGIVISSLSDIRKIDFDDMVLKAQVPIGKRGKSGGIIFSTKKTLKGSVKSLLGTDIRGFKVNEVLAEERITIDQELYLSLTISRKDKSITVLFSDEGGMDIEELAEKHPEKIKKVLIGTKLSIKDRKIEAQLNSLIKKLHTLMVERDATLVEINPLVVKDKRLIALDSKITIDDNALYRQGFSEKDMNRSFTDIEIKANKQGIKYVQLDGNIGVIGNGAGLVMATLDLIAHHKGKPANFLDVGGGADAKGMFTSMDICLSNKTVKGLFINIFGGITRCDDIAKGIMKYKKKMRVRIPLVVRMVGTNEEEAKDLLKKENIEMYDSMDLCTRKIIGKMR